MTALWQVFAAVGVVLLGLVVIALSAWCIDWLVERRAR